MSVYYYLLTLLLNFRNGNDALCFCAVIAVFVNMGFSNEDKVLIKSLFELKGYNAHQSMKAFPNKDWNKSSLNRLLKKLRDTGTVNRRPGSGRRRTARTDNNVQLVDELVQSQEDDKLQTHRTLREISRETGIHLSSVKRIVHRDLNLRCFKKRRAHEITDANCQARLQRSRLLLRRFPQTAVDFIFFTDEKVFTVASPVNTQNDRVYAPSSTKKRDIAPKRLLRCRPTFSKSLMVSVAVSKLGCTELFFVQPGVKVDGRYYREVLLKEQMLPVMRPIAGDTFVFQQDSAPAHRARDTVQLLQQETPAFTHPTCGRQTARI